MREDIQLTAPTTLEIIRILPGPIERVWDHLTQSHLRAKWLCAGEVESRPGGKIIFDFDHRRLSNSPPPEDHKDQQVVTFEGEVLRHEPPHTLAFRWPEEDGAGTIVTIRLETVDDGVRLHLVHDRLSKPAHRNGAAGGWHAHLDLLDDVLNGREVRDFWLHYTPLEAKYEAQFAQK